MKIWIKRMLILLLALLILIQFFRPEKNKSNKIDIHDIATKYNVPDKVKKILQASCYDCHSNNTVYPWYAEVQPVSWWLNDHIQGGKWDVNFSEFTTYPIGRQYAELDEINKHVKNDEMPLKSYVLIHRYAILSTEQKLIIANWVTDVRAVIKANYPADSLIKKRFD